MILFHQRLLGLALLAALFGTAGQAGAQNNNLSPTYGKVTLKAGFLPDPHVKDLVAGGNIKTKLGGVSAQVANAPDYQLFYTRGKYPLTFRVESKGDTTLLINLPNGKWIANDDGGKGRNPQITLAEPLSGRYDIFVGTYIQAAKTVPARLFITERSSPGTPPAKQTPTAKPGYVEFVHGGAYVANFKVSWQEPTAAGSEKFVPRQATFNKKTLGWKHTLMLPEGCRKIRVFAEEYYLIGKTRMVLDKTYSSAPRVSIRVYGTTLSPRFSENHAK